MHNRREQTDIVERRALRTYVGLIFILFAILLLRLLYLQVLSRDALTLKSINNIIQAVPTPAPRGNIFDRKKEKLAYNETILRLLYKPPLDIARYLPDRAQRREIKAGRLQWTYLYEGEPDEEHTGQKLEEVEKLAMFLGVPYERLMQNLQRELLRLNGESFYGYKPATLVDKLTYAQVVYLEEHRDEYQGFFIDHPFERSYPLGEAGAHLLGFTGYASDSDKDFIKKMGFTIQEKVGKDGIEMQYEELLHGQQGRRNIEVDRNRIFQDIISEVPPEKGTDIYLTIDRGVQQAAWRALGGGRGAIVVMALMPGHEGEVLALVSSPAFDPYRINESEYFTKLNENERIKPMLNRAYRGTFAPGSTFKLATASALLQSKTVTTKTSAGCSGKIPLGKHKLDMHCWNRAGHGYLSMVPAIARSCDVYFYRGGLSIKDKEPADTIAYYARQFGYGVPTGIDLYGESRGRTPDMEWWVRTKKANGYKGSDLLWYDGNTCNYMIGQGDVVSTPLQVMQSAAIVAWKGKRYEPHLLLGHGANSKVVRERKREAQSTKLEPDVLAVVAQGMRAAVTMGTCKQLDALGISACAKTGTAENKGNDHAWVCGYYPAGAPRYAFVCLVEHGGHGAEAAIPPMKQVLQYMQKHEPIKDS